MTENTIELSLSVYAVAVKEYVAFVNCIVAVYDKIGLKVPTNRFSSLDRATTLQQSPPAQQPKSFGRSRKTMIRPFLGTPVSRTSLKISMLCNVSIAKRCQTNVVIR